MPTALKTQKLGFLQGNFDQSLLFLKGPDFESRARAYLAPIRHLSLEDRAGWISGLGHGVLQHTPEANVRRLVQLIREVMA
jgi:uroporphyrinogen decarboxylase